MSDVLPIIGSRADYSRSDYFFPRVGSSVQIDPRPGITRNPIRWLFNALLNLLED